MKRNVQPIPGRYWATSFIMALVPYIRRESGGMLDHDQIDTAPPTNSQLMASVLCTYMYIQRVVCTCTYYENGEDCLAMCTNSALFITHWAVTWGPICTEKHVDITGTYPDYSLIFFEQNTHATINHHKNQFCLELPT